MAVFNTVFQSTLEEMMKFIKHLEGLVSSKIELSKSIYTLFKLEARLAGLNVYPLLLSLCILIALAITLWLTLMVLVGYLIVLLTQQPLIAIITVLFINGGLSFLIIKGLKRYLQQMSFQKTRNSLRKPPTRNEKM